MLQERKARRHIEQRYKAKRKRASVAMRKEALNRNTNDGNDGDDDDDDDAGDTNSEIHDYAHGWRPPRGGKRAQRDNCP